MKKISLKYILLLAMGVSASCTDETIPSVQEQEIKNLIITGKDFVEAYPQSRTTVEITNQGAIFKWSDNDTVGIFPDKGAQAYFVLQSNSGKTATFTGGGWALKSSSTYGAYYPFIPDFALTRTTIPVDFSHQIQKGNASTAHLSKCDYLTAIPSRPKNGIVSMDFNHMGCLFHFTTTALPHVKLDKVTLEAQEKVFPNQGILNIDEGRIVVDEPTMTSTFTLLCEDVTTTAQSAQLTVNMMIPPFNLTGKKFYLNMEYSDGSRNRIEVKGDNYEAGMAYNLTSEALRHEQILIIEHYAENYVIPVIEGSVDVSGKIYWGDYSEDVYSMGASHMYSDNAKSHIVTIGLKNANKVKFNTIEGISCIDLTKM